jgi:replicative DNA helicase
MLSCEENLIGILLNDVFWSRDENTTAKLVDAMDIARREYFSTDLGKVTYSAIIKVIQDDKVPDLILVDQLLETNHTYQTEQGRSQLMTMARNATSPVNAVKYAEMVRSEYFLRDAEIKMKEAVSILRNRGEAKNKIDEALNLVGSISTDYDLTKKDLSFQSSVNEMMDHLLKVADAGSSVTGLDTGFKRLNEHTHGLQNGNTIVVAGLPGGGKTTFCLNIMTHAAFNQKKKVLFYSLEMPRHEISMKICSSLTNINMSDFQTAKIVEEKTKQAFFGQNMPSIKDVNFTIDDDSSITAETIENRTKKHALKMGGVDLICVDYLTLMDAQGESETVRAGNAAKALKRLAKKFNCPVIIISQFVKNVVGRPTKADLRQTGQLGQDASLILFLHKDENQVVEQGTRKLIELIIDKNRMGQTGELVYEPYFETNKLIESDKELKYPLDTDGNEIKKPRSIKRVK